MKQDVTVVVACYNHAPYVQKALEAALAQTERPRVIVTDDASHDGSQDIIRGFVDEHGLEEWVLVLHEENRGLCPTFNEALGLVTTPFVAFISADDWMAPDRVQHQAQLLRSAPTDVVMYYADVRTVGATGEPGGLWSTVWPPARRIGLSGDIFRELLEGNFIPAPSVMVRTQALRHAGGYDEALFFEDHDMWLRLSSKARIGFDDHPTVFYRVHDSSMSSGLTQTQDERLLRAFLHMYAKHLGRDDQTDEFVTARLYDWACRGYKMGLPRALTVPHLWRYMVRNKSPRALAHTARALLGWGRPIAMRG